MFKNCWRSQALIAMTAAAALIGCGAELKDAPDAPASLAPFLRSSVPAEGQRDVVAVGAQLSFSFVFDQPMVTTQGALTITDGLETFEVSVRWPDNDFTAVADLAGLLEPGRDYRLTLANFAGVNGGAPVLAQTLGDEILDFTTSLPTEDRPPFVVTSNPGMEATGVYPAQVFNGTAPRVSIRIDFSEPMDSGRRTISWGSADGGTQEELAGSWSADGLVFTADVLAPPATGRHPLEDSTRYAIDLRRLRDRAGNLLTPNVVVANGQLMFTTGVYEPLLNHSCGHVFFGPYDTVTAAVAPGPTITRTDTAHTAYTVTLPGPPYAGFTRYRAATDASVHLFLDGEDSIKVTDELGVPVLFSVRTTPSACPGISHELLFHTAAGQRFLFEIGPQSTSQRRFIVEAVSQ